MPAGILILHGFTGSPRDAADLKRSLTRHLDATVRVPRLPGHGTTPDDLFRVTAADWLATARQAYDRLAVRHGRVAIIGVSFGANLMFKLASERRPAALVALGAPARMKHQLPFRVGVKFMKLWTKTYLKKGPHKNERIPGYRQSAYDQIPLVALEEFFRFLEREMRPSVLARVTAPTLLVQSTIDPIVAPGSRPFFLRHLGSAVKRELIWKHHRHLLIQGGEKEALFIEIANFVRPYLDPHTFRGRASHIRRGRSTKGVGVDNQT